MHRNDKRDAQIAEEAGLTAEPESHSAVTKADPGDEEGIEAAQQLARAKEAAEAAKRAPARAPTPSRLDQLDRERADGEGMTAPPSAP